MTDDPTPIELPPPPGIPWATLLSALAVLLLFAGLVMGVLRYAQGLGAKPAAASGEQQLQELRAQERDILDNYGFEPTTQTWRIPIDRAMEVLAEEGKAKGELTSFPTKKRP